MHVLLLIGWFCLLGFAPSQKHDLHLSVTTIQHDSTTETLRININLFTDDLEAALEKRGATGLYLGKTNEHPESNTHITSYLNDQFALTVDGQALTLERMNKEMTFDAVQCLFDIPDVPTAETVEIYNNIFHELFDDQTNLVRVQANGGRKLISLNKEQQNGLVSL